MEKEALFLLEALHEEKETDKEISSGWYHFKDMFLMYLILSSSFGCHSSCINYTVTR